MHDTSLAGNLQRWSVIGGYHRIYDKPLSDCLDADPAPEWGPLVNLCRSSEPEHMYQLMTQLGVIASGEDVDMELVRTLIAFCFFDDLKSLDPPAYTFVGFRPYQGPSVDSLMSLIEDCYVPYNSDHDFKLGKRLSAKRVSEVEAARREHEERCKRGGREFASFFLHQWPCKEPTV